MKTSDVKKKSGTHFEQVPLEVVKKIAGAEESKETAGTDNLIMERVPVKTEPYGMPSGLLAKPGL
jgi:hypothetical protein